MNNQIRDSIRPIRDMILFTFHDASTKIENKAAFEERTRSGIVYKDYEQTINSPRWGTVVAVGPDVNSQIRVGSSIWIEPLGWTTAYKFLGEEPFWFTSETKVIGTAE